MSLLTPRLLRVFHGLAWVFISVVALFFILLAIAAYGIPGTWLQSLFDNAISPEVGKLTVERVSYLPLRGAKVEGLTLRSPEGEVMASFSLAQIGLPLFSLRSIPERITSITVEDLYVAQPEFEDDGEPPPDFSKIELPNLRTIQVKLLRSDVIDIKVDSANAQLSTEGQTLRFANIASDVSDAGEHVEGFVEIDFAKQVVNLSLRGHIFQTRINGIWTLFELDVVRHYSDNFHLKAPAWGDFSICVGLNKYHDIFRLNGQIVALGGGDYCGVPFDEASTTVTSESVWETRTTFNNIKAYRNGKLAAEGSLFFDVGNDKFEFSAINHTLSPKECLQIVDEPFTEVIPEITAETPPQLNLVGRLPLMTPQTPSKVFLDGTIALPNGGSIYGLKVDAAETALKMANGTVALHHAKATLPTDKGEVSGTVSFEIPEAADYADISAAVHFANASLKDIAQPFSRSKNIPEATATGFADLHCRTGDNILSTINGDFSCVVEGGLITRARIFSGLTNVMADYIPGISSITDVSKATVNGSVTNGVVLVPDFELTGDLLSVEGTIAFDLPQDTINAELSAGNFKRGSVMGYLTRWATRPLNTLVWHIRVSGPRKDLDWKVHTFVNTLWDSTLGRIGEDSEEETPVEITPIEAEEEESSGGVLSWFGLGGDEAEEEETPPAETAPSTK